MKNSNKKNKPEQNSQKQLQSLDEAEMDNVSGGTKVSIAAIANSYLKFSCKRCPLLIFKTPVDLSKHVQSNHPTLLSFPILSGQWKCELCQATQKKGSDWATEHGIHLSTCGGF
jgi:hypothetical protein